MSKTLVNPNVLFHRHNPLKLSNKCSASDNMKQSSVFIIWIFYVPCTVYILIYITNCTSTIMYKHPTLAKLQVSERRVTIRESYQQLTQLLRGLPDESTNAVTKHVGDLLTSDIYLYISVAYPGILVGGGFNKFSWGKRTEITGIWRR
jgi:hypothetical protein